ncbi:MAG: PIN domain-containing protein [Pyrinomonadaceae bacterium]|nr:PIN domain-containing protein [Pyrinomonadaceae bacterium]
MMFLDTSYVLALELSNDQYHKVAIEHWSVLIKSLPPLVTNSYIFDEIITYFNSRGFHAKAVEVGNRLFNSSSVTFIHVDENLFEKGWIYFQKYGDKRSSLTDCISFVTMDELKMETALTFDKHFVQAGFKVLP